MRTEKEKWQVPESDPAGTAKKDRIDIPNPSGLSGIEDTDRALWRFDEAFAAVQALTPRLVREIAACAR